MQCRATVLGVAGWATQCYTRLVRLTTHTDHTTLYNASRMALGWRELARYSLI